MAVMLQKFIVILKMGKHIFCSPWRERERAIRVTMYNIYFANLLFIYFVCRSQPTEKYVYHISILIFHTQCRMKTTSSTTHTHTRLLMCMRESVIYVPWSSHKKGFSCQNETNVTTYIVSIHKFSFLREWGGMGKQKKILTTFFSQEYSCWSSGRELRQR